MNKRAMPKCPVCNRFAEYGERDAFSQSFGETPLVCKTHGEIGYRDHDYGDFVIYKKFQSSRVDYWGA